MKTTTTNILFKKFRNTSEFGRAVAVSAPGRVFAGCSLSSEYEGDPDFYGTNDFATAEKLRTFGDSDSAALLQRCGASAPVRVVKNEFRRRPVSGVVGFAPCVPAYLLGRPENMINFAKVKKSAKIISFAYALNFPARVDASTAARVSALLLSAVNQIELAGYRINLDVCNVSQERNEIFAASVTVKQSGQNCDIKKLAYYLINPAFKRRHYFRLLENSVTDSAFRYGYGSPCQDYKKISAVVGLPVICFSDIQHMNVGDIVALINERCGA